jgi:acetolactate synthase-1/2/3 large subunit
MDQRRLLTQRLRIPDAIVQVLIDAGVPAVFGIPGGLTGQIFGALHERRDEITTVITRQETLASAMAETTGRLTGSPSVLMGQGPWVLGYGGVGAIEALLSSTPMLIMTDFSDAKDFSLHGRQAPCLCDRRAGEPRIDATRAKRSRSGLGVARVGAAGRDHRR